MFSQVSVSHSVNRGWVCLVPCHFQGVFEGISGARSLLGEDMSMVGMSEGVGTHPPRHGPEGGGEYPSPADTYWQPPHIRWQANGTHPTGMLSSVHMRLLKNLYVSME